MGRARESPDDEQEPGLSDLDREVADQLPETVLAGGLGLDEAGRERVGVRALTAGLDQPELGHVAADRRLGRPEAALAERRCQLLLGPDLALVDEVADGPLAELLHDLHGATGLSPATSRGRSRRARAGTRRRR